MIRVDTDAFDAVLAYWRPALDGEGHRCSLLTSDEPCAQFEHAVVALRGEGPAKLYRFENGSHIYARVLPMAEAPAGLEVLARLEAVDGSTSSFVLEDSARHVIYLPFSPDEAVRSFLDEAYVPPASVTRSSALSVYYAVKRYVPRSWTMAARSLLARRQARSITFPKWPVDHSLDDLQRLVLTAILRASEAVSIPFVWFWPDGKHSALILTHDVEGPSGRDMVSTFIDAEQSLGLASSFNVVPNKYEVPPSLLYEVTHQGNEIGVHGWDHQGSLVGSRAIFNDRVGRINAVAGAWAAVGFRSPSTYRNAEWFQELAVEYDSSFPDTDPFEPQSGGCLSVFPYLMGRLVELPITMPQDHTLFTLLGEKDERLWREKADAIRSRHGLICMLTHPDTEDGYTGSARVFPHYVKMLQGFADDPDTWHALPRDVARWWRRRAGVSLNSESAFAEGPTSAGCAVGWASLQDGELVLAVEHR